MAAHKKQHYLPASYLKFFSDDQSNCDRKTSRIWRFDGDKLLRVPVDSQCFGDYFYSKKSPSETEKIFQSREVIYCNFVDEIRAGKEPSRNAFGDLFLCMVDLQLRNGIHKNNTGKEGIEAYDMRLGMFFYQMLLRKPDADSLIPAVKLHLHHHWRMEIIQSPSTVKFATSDNPSLFTSLVSHSPNRNSPLQMIFLPLDPNNVAVAFDKRFMWITPGQATENDARTLNHNQIQNAENCIFSSHSILSSDLQKVHDVFATKPKAISEIDMSGWRSFKQYLPPEHYFSFMKIKPSVL